MPPFHPSFNSREGPLFSAVRNWATVDMSATDSSSETSRLLRPSPYYRSPSLGCPLVHSSPCLPNSVAAHADNSFVPFLLCLLQSLFRKFGLQESVSAEDPIPSRRLPGRCFRFLLHRSSFPSSIVNVFVYPPPPLPKTL